MKIIRVAAAVLSLLILSATGVSSQTRIAVTGGVDFATWKSWPRNNESVRGFSTGVSAILPTHGVFEFEFRGVYTRRGRTDSFAGVPTWPPGAVGTLRKTWQVSENHLGLASLGRVSLPVPVDGLRAYMAAGPALSWETSCRHTRITFETPWSFDRPGTWTWKCRGRDRLDFGLTGGAGMEYRIAEDMGVTFSTTYTHGLRNLAKALYQGRGEFTRLRAVNIRAGLVRGIG